MDQVKDWSDPLSCEPILKAYIFTTQRRGSQPVVNALKANRAVLHYALHLTPLAASGGVKLTRVITTLDGLLRP